MSGLTLRGDARQVADGVHELVPAEWGFEYKAFLVEADVPTLFDTGWAESVDELMAAIEATGVTPERLVLTHGDVDHVGGFDAVVERYDPETYVPVETALDAESDADHRVADGDRIGSFEAVHVPGHSDDSYAYVDETMGLVVMGDAVNGSDIRGHPPGNVLLPPEVFSADLHAAERNLGALLDYEFEVALVSHGSSVERDAGRKLEQFVRFDGHPDTR